MAADPRFTIYCGACTALYDTDEKKPEVCRECGSADIEIDHEYGPFCSSCDEKCNVIVVDEGIGAYEFWGDRGVHHDYRAVSDCCEADAWEDRKKTIPAEYEPDDYYDPPDPEPWVDPHELWGRR